MPKQPVQTGRAPMPRSGAPYSQAITFGELVFVSGQLPIDPDTGQTVDGDVRAQTAQVLDNIEQILTAAGSDMSKILKTTVFLVDHGDWAAMNEVYRERVGSPYPARSAVTVADLSLGVLIEIDVIAHR